MSEILSEMTMSLWQPCCQDLVPLKNLEKNQFFVNYFYFANVESGSWQEHFPVNFFLNFHESSML